MLPICRLRSGVARSLTVRQRHVGSKKFFIVLIRSCTHSACGFLPSRAKTAGASTHTLHQNVQTFCVSFRKTSSFSKHRTHYEVLELGKDATPGDIRAAFLRKSKECHPDLNRSNPHTHQLFVQVNEAYSVLSKPQARRSYDLALDHRPSHSAAQHGASEYYHHPKGSTSTEEWLRSSGLKEEYFRQNNQHNHAGQTRAKVANFHIAAGCLVFMLSGIVFHFYAVKLSSEKHLKNLNEHDTKTHELWMKAKHAAKEFTPRELTQHLLDKQVQQGRQPNK